MEAHSCIGFGIDCGVLWKGALTTVLAFTIFIGCIWVVLAAIFGRRMGYLVLTVTLSGWMIILSATWLFGFWSQGLETPTNLGPRGAEPAWLVLNAGIDVTSREYPVADRYPTEPWADLSGSTVEASLQGVTGAVQVFLAEEANAELGREEGDPDAVESSQFNVENIRFAVAPDGSTSLAMGQANFAGGGPQTTVLLRHDSGSIPRYSYMFLAGSILLFLIHLPLLDRAERSRREILTGGEAPPWYGPA
ncbi:MAG: hypothetical protein WEA10_09035 [Actinomycetota bacterium]